MRNKSILPTLLIASLCFSSIIGCKSQAIDYTLSPDITQYVKHSINVVKVIGENFRIIKSKIKGRQLLMKATNKDKITYFIGINLADGKLMFTIPDPSDDYIFSVFDINNDTLISMMALQPSKIFMTNLTTRQTNLNNVEFKKPIRPGEIIFYKGRIFLINDVYGVSCVNSRDFSKTVFYNGSGYTINPLSSTLAFPIDSSLNLLLGHVIENKAKQLYALDFKDSIKWKYIINQNSPNNAITASALNCHSSFIVKYDSALVSLDKTNGRELWRKSLANSITQIYKWNDKILVYSLVNPSGMFPDREDFEYHVVLKLFHSENGRELWSKSISSINVPNIGICSDKLLIADNNSFRVFSMNSAEEITNKSFSQNEKSHYSFEMLSDIVTGDYYLKSYNGIVYW